MIKLTIDGKPVTANDGATILEAARSAGIDIPTICYRGKTAAPVSCFVCVVRVEGRGGFLPSCATAVCEGMEVDTCSGEVRDCRRRAIELLFSEHVGDCAGCGKKGSCALLSFAALYGARRRRYAMGSPKEHPAKRYDSGLVHEPGKCIVCGRCVHITRERNVSPGLSLCGRGSDVHVAAPFGTPIDEAMGEALSECVEACPTGALWVDSDKSAYYTDNRK